MENLVINHLFESTEEQKIKILSILYLKYIYASNTNSIDFYKNFHYIMEKGVEDEKNILKSEFKINLDFNISDFKSIIIDELISNNLIHKHKDGGKYHNLIYIKNEGIQYLKNFYKISKEVIEWYDINTNNLPNEINDIGCKIIISIVNSFNKNKNSFND